MISNKKVGGVSSGFYTVGIIVALVVCIGLVLVGWFVWRSQGTQQTVSDTSTQEQEQDPSEGGKYLVIEEWGVRFELPEGLRGDIKTYVSGTEVSGTVSFASERLNTLYDEKCGFVRQPDGRYAGGIQAVLSRINLDTYPKESLDTYRQSLDHILSIGDYDFYSGKLGGLTCATAIGGDDPIPGFYDAERDISQRLVNSFTTLEPTEQ